MQVINPRVREAPPCSAVADAALPELYAFAARAPESAEAGGAEAATATALEAAESSLRTGEDLASGGQALGPLAGDAAS
jgi:hypothetical protein